MRTQTPHLVQADGIGVRGRPSRANVDSALLPGTGTWDGKQAPLGTGTDGRENKLPQRNECNVGLRNATMAPPTNVRKCDRLRPPVNLFTPSHMHKGPTKPNGSGRTRACTSETHTWHPTGGRSRHNLPTCETKCGGAW